MRNKDEIDIDSVAYMTCTCRLCDHEWTIDMMAIVTGYDHSYGEDEPKECPACAEQREENGNDRQDSE